VALNIRKTSWESYLRTIILSVKTKTDVDLVEIKNKHFVSSLGEGVEKLKKMLHAVAKENGLYKAMQQVLICDGASW